MANFLSLPPELRIKVYKHLLVRRKRISPLMNLYPDDDYGVFGDDRGYIRFNYDLLYTNKLLNGEFSELVYAHHHFDLSATPAAEVVEFLDTIGPENVKHIRHLTVHFPKFSHDDTRREYALENGNLRMFLFIETHAINLKTLILAPARKDFVKLQREKPKTVAKKLSVLQKHLQAIPTLDKVIVEVYWRFPREHLLKQVENYGMKVKRLDVPFGACHSTFRSYDVHAGKLSGSEYESGDDSGSDFWERLGAI